MKYSPSDYARILYRTKDSDALIGLLKTHWVLAWLPKIREEFGNILKKEEHIEEVSVVSAYPLNESVRNDIVRLLELVEKKKKLELNFIIDKSVIGGFRVKSDEILISASLKDKINLLREKL